MRRQNRSLIGKSDKVEAPASTSFMYQAPPGMREAQQRQQQRHRDEKAEQTRAERDAERFAILQNAPTRGEHTKDIDVRHRPFGVTIRQVQCKRCGQWGHQAGERECSMRNAPTDLDNANKLRDDPIARVAAGGEASGGALRWEPKAAPEAGVHGGASAADANQQFVTMLDDDDLADGVAAQGAGGSHAGGSGVSMADLDPAVLSMLNEKQQRRLLKLYQKEVRGHDDGDSGDGGTERKRKKHKHKHEKSGRESKKHSKHKRQKESDKHRSGGVKGDRRDRDSMSGSDSGSA
jgi:hypothetical protein